MFWLSNQPHIILIWVSMTFFLRCNRWILMISLTSLSSLKHPVPPTSLIFHCFTTFKTSCDFVTFPFFMLFPVLWNYSMTECVSGLIISDIRLNVHFLRSLQANTVITEVGENPVRAVCAQEHRNSGDGQWHWREEPVKMRLTAEGIESDWESSSCICLP